MASLSLGHTLIFYYDLLDTNYFSDSLNLFTCRNLESNSLKLVRAGPFFGLERLEELYVFLTVFLPALVFHFSVNTSLMLFALLGT